VKPDHVVVLVAMDEMDVPVLQAAPVDQPDILVIEDHQDIL
jgi:hypothetical protein